MVLRMARVEIVLNGKKMMSVITAGGGRDAYTADGYNKHTIREYLAPFEQTANLCGMKYLPPLVVHNAISLDLNLELHHITKLYQNILNLLIEGKVNLNKVSEFEYINDYYKTL